MQDASWYTDDDINFLLKKEFAEKDDVQLLTPMTGTPWSQGKEENRTLRDNLNQLLQSTNLKNKKVVVPVNLGKDNGEGIHWVLLYFTLDNNAQLETIFYVDPLGNSIDSEMRKDLEEIFPRLNNLDNSMNISEVKLQVDRHNCGPWIIEIAKSLVNQGIIPEKTFNIEKSRKNHAKIIEKSRSGTRFDTPSQAKSSSPALHKLHQERFSIPRLKKALEEVFKDKNIFYEEKDGRMKAKIEDDGKVFNFEQKSQFCEFTTLKSDENTLVLMVERTAKIIKELGLTPPPVIEIIAPDETARKILERACDDNNLIFKVQKSVVKNRVR